MSQLETEIEGHAGCVGPAVPSEVWSVPAEHRYHSRAIGGVIRYAVLSLEKHQVNVKSTPESREFEIVAGSRDDVLHSAVVELSQAVEHVDDLSQMAKATLSDAICWHLEERYLCIPQTTDGETAYLLTKSDARLLRSFIYENLAERITLTCWRDLLT